MTATTATKSTSPRRRRLLSALGITVASLALGVVGQTSTASAQGSIVGQTYAQCGYGSVSAYGPTVYGEQGGSWGGGTAMWVADLYRYNYSTRTWQYVSNSRSATYYAPIVTNAGPGMGGYMGTAGPSWNRYGAYTNWLTWRVATGGTYKVVNWVSDGTGVWVSQSTNYCNA